RIPGPGGQSRLPSHFSECPLCPSRSRHSHVFHAWARMHTGTNAKIQTKKIPKDSVFEICKLLLPPPRRFFFFFERLLLAVELAYLKKQTVLLVILIMEASAMPVTKFCQAFMSRTFC
ncbi:UNVERIFIED_CONTAM: hypothetical protein K2H54_056954, partial [Gekko kuhli]